MLPLRYYRSLSLSPALFPSSWPVWVVASFGPVVRLLLRFLLVASSSSPRRDPTRCTAEPPTLSLLLLLFFLFLSAAINSQKSVPSNSKTSPPQSSSALSSIFFKISPANLSDSFPYGDFSLILVPRELIIRSNLLASSLFREMNGVVKQVDRTGPFWRVVSSLAFVGIELRQAWWWWALGEEPRPRRSKIPNKTI